MKGISKLVVSASLSMFGWKDDMNLKTKKALHKCLYFWKVHPLHHIKQQVNIFHDFHELFCPALVQLNSLKVG